MKEVNFLAQMWAFCEVSGEFYGKAPECGFLYHTESRYNGEEGISSLIKAADAFTRCFSCLEYIYREYNPVEVLNAARLAAYKNEGAEDEYTPLDANAVNALALKIAHEAVWATVSGF